MHIHRLLGPPRLSRQKIMEMKEEVGTDTAIVEYFNSPLLPTNWLDRLKINKAQNISA